MKQANSALYVLLTVCVLISAFAFGRHVSRSAATPLRQANAVAEQQATRNQWTVEALGVKNSNSLALADSSSETRIASDDASSDGGSDNSGSIYGADSQLVTFQQVYELLKEQYVNKIPSDTPLAHGAVAALVAALDDPNSRFMESAERQDVDAEDKGIYTGTGIVFTVRKETVDGLFERQLTVVDSIVGSPAAKAGLQTGDVITEINGHWVVSFDPFAAQEKLFKSLAKDPVSFNHAVDATESKIKDGYTLSQAQTMLDTVQTAPLQLSVLRAGQPLKITVDGSSSTTVTDVDSKLLADGNGYIQVNAFTDSTAGDFTKAMTALSSAPGIVVDLRNCPGGDIDPALVLAKSLAADQPLGSVVIRDSHGIFDRSVGFPVKVESLVYVSTGSQTVPSISYAGRLAVLVNDGTANTAELFAAFLHDRLGAHMVGTTTFGDGMASTLFPMPDGSGFTLTTGLVKTSANTVFEAKGLVPDVALAESDTDGETGLSRAEAALALKPATMTAAGVAVGGQKS